jgi:hypothetical protein
MGAFRRKKVSSAREIVFGHHGIALPRGDGKNIFLHKLPRIRVDLVGPRVIVVVVIREFDIVDGKS